MQSDIASCGLTLKRLSFWLTATLNQYVIRACYESYGFQRLSLSTVAPELVISGFAENFQFVSFWIFSVRCDFPSGCCLCVVQVRLNLMKAVMLSFGSCSASALQVLNASNGCL